MPSSPRSVEAEAGEHDLHAFQAIRRMDEILVNNFMVYGTPGAKVDMAIEGAKGVQLVECALRSWKMQTRRIEPAPIPMKIRIGKSSFATPASYRIVSRPCSPIPSRSVCIPSCATRRGGHCCSGWPDP